MADPDVSVTRLDPDSGELTLGVAGEHVGRDRRAWTAWDEEGEGRPPPEVPLRDDLPG
jgi:hypothetical protein